MWFFWGTSFLMVPSCPTSKDVLRYLYLSFCPLFPLKKGSIYDFVATLITGKLGQKKREAMWYSEYVAQEGVVK